jgi:hypothetical protein
MNAPLLFLTTHAVKDGRLEDLKALNAEFVDFVERHEPNILALHAYLSEDRSRLTIVQIHPHADSLERQVAGDKIHQALELVDNERVDVYGTPGETADTLLHQLRTAGVRVTVNPAPIGGFARYAAA